MTFSECRSAPQIRMRTRISVVIAIVATCTAATIGEQPSSFSTSLSKDESPNAQKLASNIAALSPSVDRNEARLLAESSYATVSRLRQQYRMFGTPIFNNFLVYHGFKKRGYCYQWAEDLLIALDSLKLTSLELHWGESYPGTWRENNCVVATAKGQPFNRGILLECWEHFGHLRWGPVVGDRDPYVENAAYGRFVRARAAQKTFGVNHPVALQTRSVAKGKNY